MQTMAVAHTAAPSAKSLGSPKDHDKGSRSPQPIWITFRESSLASGHCERIQTANKTNSPITQPSTASCPAINKIGSGCLLLIGHVSQFQDGLGLELPNPFSGDVDLTSNFSKRQRFFSVQSEAQSQDFLFPFIELR